MEFKKYNHILEEKFISELWEKKKIALNQGLEKQKKPFLW